MNLYVSIKRRINAISHIVHSALLDSNCESTTCISLYIAPYNSQLSAILPQLCTFFTRDEKVERLAIFSGHHTAFYIRACIFVICCPLGRACLKNVLEWECSPYKAAHHIIFKSKATSPCGKKYRSLLQHFPFALLLVMSFGWSFITLIISNCSHLWEPVSSA